MTCRVLQPVHDQALSAHNRHGVPLLLSRPSCRFHQRGQHELDQALWVVCVHLRHKGRHVASTFESTANCHPASQQQLSSCHPTNRPACCAALAHAEAAAGGSQAEVTKPHSSFLLNNRCSPNGQRLAARGSACCLVSPQAAPWPPPPAAPRPSSLGPSGRCKCGGLCHCNSNSASHLIRMDDGCLCTAS